MNHNFNFMKKLLLFCLFLCGTSLLFAQFEENFDDGNLTADPEWLGNTDHFIVNGDGEMQLMAPDAGTSSIYTAVSIKDSTTWEFFFRLNFPPSTGNQLDVFLFSDSPDLTDDLNGYFLRVGLSGSNDSLQLRRQNGGSSTFVLGGTGGTVGANPATGRIRITRDAIGNWEIFSDYSGGFNFTSEGTAFDDTYNMGDYFGFRCKYTGGNVEDFFFDDIIIDPLFVDDEPPVLEGATAISSTQVDLFFNEPLNPLTAELEGNYNIDNGINVSEAILDVDQTTVHLTVTEMLSGTNYLVSSDNIEDVNNNASSSQSTSLSLIHI